MWKQLTAVVIVDWFLSVELVASTYCRGKFDIYRVCPMSYGSVLSSVHNTRSAALCSHVCMSIDDCRSWMYDPGTKVCDTNSRTEKVTSFPGGCDSTVFFGKLEKATCRDSWLDKTCSGTSDCIVLNNECYNGGCRCADGYAYHYRTDSCMANCQEYGSTYKEEYYYVWESNIITLGDSVSSPLNLQVCLDACANTYPTCRFVEYDRGAKYCTLQNWTALTAHMLGPDYIIYESNANWFQYLRNCY